MGPPYASDLADIRRAAAALAPTLAPTPVRSLPRLDAMAGRRLVFKCENLQQGGSFKLRGALTAVLRLGPEAARAGVLTHSSGNFAQALAIAGRIRGIPVTVVMPEDAPALKIEATRAQGARIVLCPPRARAETAARLQAESGATFLSSYDHPDVIAGQGTCGLELLEQVPELQGVVVPVGGGGLVAGVSLAMRGAEPALRVFGAEPEGADDALRSKGAGRRLPQTDPRTVADGLRMGLGQHTWPVLRDLVEEVLPVSDAEILAAMRLLWDEGGLRVEPSGAIGLAAVLSPAFRARPGLSVLGIVLSGGNVDPALIPGGDRPSPPAR